MSGEQPTGSTVEIRHVNADLLPQPGMHHPVVPIAVRLTFDTAEPIAVLVEFRAGLRGWVSWWLGREVLAEGLHRRVGGQDITVEPEGDDHVRLRLVGPAGPGTFLFMRGALAEFLARTYALVPAAAEFAGVDWDAAAAAWLSAPGKDHDDQ